MVIAFGSPKMQTNYIYVFRRIKISKGEASDSLNLVSIRITRAIEEHGKPGLLRKGGTWVFVYLLSSPDDLDT